MCKGLSITFACMYVIIRECALLPSGLSIYEEMYTVEL